MSLQAEASGFEQAEPGSFSDPLIELSVLEVVVARVSADYQADRAVVTWRATEILRRRYASARIQSFIPVLLEKELRDSLRELARSAAAGAGSDEGNNECR